MPRLLAIDWDPEEARYVLANAGRDKVSVLAAGSVPLAQGADARGPAHADLTEALGTVLTGRRFRGAGALVGIGRSSVEMLHLTLPPAQDAELPEMVLNQSMRESQNVGEDSALDFVPLSGNPAEPRRVVALAMSPEEVNHIRSACAAAHVKPQRIVFRPYAAASLFARGGIAAEATCLLVNHVAEEVDLTVLVGAKAVFSRTVRLPRGSDAEANCARILSEIGRTLTIAGQEDPGAETISRVYLLGSPGDHRELVQKIEEELSLHAEVFDPFQAIAAPPEAVPERAGRFASLVGMILDEVHGGAHAVDFLHPKKKPEPPNRRRRMLAIAGLGALAIATVGYNVYSDTADLDAENAQLQAKLTQLDGMASKVARQSMTVAAIRAWEAREMNWLDELGDLARRFPSGRDMLLLRMSLSPGRAGGGTVDFYGVVRDDAIVVNMERGIRDAFHGIQTRRVQESLREKDYTWQFEATVVARPRTKAQYAGLPAAPAASAAVAAKPPGTNPAPPHAAPKAPVARPVSAAVVPGAANLPSPQGRQP